MRTILYEKSLPIIVKELTHRSVKEEWPPHLGQTNSFVEWWYFTALLHDAAGNKYMLFDIFKYDSKDNPFVPTI